ncbi:MULTISPECIES: hypothetical protein [Clostridium]|uniref:Uncharacterized protein n=1 Tax=Clostridium cibarium TaxID=2762247 RepID=A0ABR8PPB5_9CLOT|nr:MULTISPECIES: hypothetical protein [Clostridium]MBD7910026.1 hypothetical protein [Clostridium cibarium]
MKKYLYNKDFLPRSFVTKKNKYINFVSKRDSIIITAIALMLLPISMSNIKYYFRENKPVIKNSDLDENLENKRLKNWLEITNDCFQGNFTSYEGNIYVYNKDDLEKVLQNEKIVINTMEDLGENKYRLQVIQEDNK